MCGSGLFELDDSLVRVNFLHVGDGSVEGEQVGERLLRGPVAQRVDCNAVVHLESRASGESCETQEPLSLGPESAAVSGSVRLGGPVRMLTVLASIAKTLLYKDKQARQNNERQKKRKDSNVIHTLGPYALDILTHLKNQEVKQTRIGSPKIILTKRQRKKAIDWFVRIASEFQLADATIHLAVSCLDRYLHHAENPSLKLKQLTPACLWAASKFEDNWDENTDTGTMLTACDIVEHSDILSTYEIVSSELKLLVQLEFKVHEITAHDFLVPFLAAAKSLFGMREDTQSSEYDKQLSSISMDKVWYLGHYLLEITLLDADLMCFRPSLLAASALDLSIGALGKSLGCNKIRQITGYSADELEVCKTIIHDLLQRNNSESGFSQSCRKYSQLFNISSLCAALKPPFPDTSLSTITSTTTTPTTTTSHAKRRRGGDS